MKPFFLAALIIFPLSAYTLNSFEDDRLDEAQIKMMKQEMEDPPSSTLLGGVRSGALEVEKSRDGAAERDLQNQKRLYQSEDSYIEGYRKGL